jgi:transposase
MRVHHERCAGMDVHKRTVVVCAITPEGREIRTFGTMTCDLCELVDWLEGQGVRVVGMESTGSYWKPMYNLLEEAGFEIHLANPQHAKAIPGRKTDVKDAEWIAELLRHGLLPTSYIPNRPQRELRELVRYRRTLVRERAREANRIQKVLEGANLKLGSVASNILGKSCRDMLRRVIEGSTDPAELAGLARGRMRSKRSDLERALRGVVGPHQRMILAEQLGHVEELEARIERLDQEIGERLRPFDPQVDALDTIPGVGRRIAEGVLAEVGADMSRFPSSGHLASWAKLCPGNHQSAGKRSSGRTGRGNPWLRSLLVEAAQAAGRSKSTYLGAQYRRLARRIGAKRATVAVAHTLLVIIYHVLDQHTTYQDLGPNYFEEIDRHRIARATQRRLEALDFHVQITDLRNAA